jgi:hypothetical protein
LDPQRLGLRGIASDGIDEIREVDLVHERSTEMPDAQSWESLAIWNAKPNVERLE